MGIFDCKYRYFRYEGLVDATITQRRKRIMCRDEEQTHWIYEINREYSTLIYKFMTPRRREMRNIPQCVGCLQFHKTLL